MEPKSWTLFNILINRYHGADAQAFVSSLPKETVAQLAKYPSESQETRMAARPATDMLRSMHHSWWTEAFQALSPTLQPMVLASLPKGEGSRLAKALQMQNPRYSVSPPLKQLLLDQFAATAVPSSFIPLDYLPDTPIKQLAMLSRNDLIQVIDLLGLRDLAEATRSMVDKRHLQAIQQALTPTERLALKGYLQQREKLKVPKLDLAGWDGERHSLRVIYHHRGLIRLAKALTGQPEEILWLITRKLDKRRANILSSHMDQAPIGGVTPLLMAQTMGVLDFLKRQQSEEAIPE